MVYKCTIHELFVDIMINVQACACYNCINGSSPVVKILKRDIPWETYMSTKLISGTGLQLIKRYDKKPQSSRAQLLDEVIILPELLFYMNRCYIVHFFITCIIF